MTAVDRRPARLGTALSLSAAFLAVGATAFASAQALAVAGAGVPVLAVGLVRGSRRAVTAGAALTFVGLLFGGMVGLPAPPLLVGVTAAVVSWDVGENAISVGEQLGREAHTASAELAHAAVSAVVGAVAAGFGFAVYSLSGGGLPLATLAFMLVAAVALGAALRG